MREFLHVDNMAEASIFVMNFIEKTYQRITQPMLSHINVGSGVDCTIKELTGTVAKVVGYQGKIEWDTSKSDGAPRKQMDVSRLERLGWKSMIDLEQGLAKSYAWFLENQTGFRY
jgi:GDP-L-fucose synthase